MLKRFARWLLSLIIFAFVIFVVVIIVNAFEHHYSPGSVLVLQLDGPVVERSNLSTFSLISSNETPLDVVLHALRNAQDDPRIVGLAIRSIDPQFELAQAEEVTSAIDSFRRHGKWVCAWMETAGEGGFGNLPYYVASSADPGELSMMSIGQLNLLGVGIREMFARGTLDWLKITPNFDAIGKYKDAANIFTGKDFTPGQHEEDDALAGAMYDQIVQGISAHRHLTPAAVQALVDRAPLDADDGLQSKLLDRLEYEDQFNNRMRHFRGEHHHLVDYDSYGPSIISRMFTSRPKIAVIYGVGAIQQGNGGGFDPFSVPGEAAMDSDDMVDAFNTARKDDSIRAILFRVNSPGGAVMASELIRRAAERAAAKKPLVVSMSTYAASGGFWISTPASEIIAEPGTITGSIGVLGGKFNISGATTALGINTGAITRGANALMFDSFTDFTPSQWKIFDNVLLGNTYQYFLKLVADSRHMTVAQVNNIAQGRVWTGDQALGIHLIDKIGGFDTALAEAKRLAKIDPQQRVELVELPEQPGLLTRMLTGQVYARAYAQVYQQFFSSQALTSLQAFAPMLAVMRDASQHHAGEVFCPVIPVM
ncbi:MAG TPA: signal peptide peptidase SppA [Candidatus Binataceae bacterium]|nr:signal peptide peptidase SppA [Candidatus Binataceae bacterium]